MRGTLLIFAAWSLLAAPAARAEDWIGSVFPETSFDFGTVARGSKIRHAFPIINRTGQDIHIADWRTKCGCTEVRVGSRDIPPGTRTVVEATIDTSKFLGFKASGLTLVLDRPTRLDVDLNLTCFIRSDVTLAPGVLDFGEVDRASRPTMTLTMTYAGGLTDWQIREMQTGTRHVTAELRSLGSNAGGVAQYQILARLNPSVPPGHFKDELTLLTTDPSSPRIPISISAHVVTGVSVSPAILNLGPVKAGSVLQRTVLVRSKRPFQVTDIKSNRTDLSATPPAEAARTFHTLTLILKVPAQAGPYNAQIEIQTDLENEPPATVLAFATVVP